MTPTWGPAHAARQLATGVFTPRQPDHPRISRAVAGLRDLDSLVGTHPQNWSQEVQDWVIILAAHYGLPEEYFTDPTVAAEELDFVESWKLVNPIDILCSGRGADPVDPHAQAQLIRSLIKYIAYQIRRDREASK